MLANAGDSLFGINVRPPLASDSPGLPRALLRRIYKLPRFVPGRFLRQNIRTRKYHGIQLPH